MKHFALVFKVLCRNPTVLRLPKPTFRPSNETWLACVQQIQKLCCSVWHEQGKFRSRLLENYNLTVKDNRMVIEIKKCWTFTYLETQHVLQRKWKSVRDSVGEVSLREHPVLPAEKTRNLSRKNRMPSLGQRLDTFYSCSLLLARQNGGKFFYYVLVNFGVMFWLSFG